MPPKPAVLAFDTSAAHCAAALLLGDEVVDAVREPMAKGQAERLIPMLEEMLARHALAWEDLTSLGVCTGPGNFTGVRISVSAARGFALALNKPAVGVSRFDAMALGSAGQIVCVLDARRDRIYLQRFQDGVPLDEPAMIERTEADLSAATVIADPNEPTTASLFPDASAPAYDVAHATALITATRAATDQPRPVPLYLRAADAALPSEPPVVILP